MNKKMTFQRCPSCGSRVASNASLCPICGHEFPPEPVATPPAEPVAASSIAGRRVGSARQRRRFSLAQLPWGVIGVAAVIVALALGAVLLLRGTGGAGSNLAPTASANAVAQATGTRKPAASVTATAQVSATQAATPTLAATPTSSPIPVTDTPAPPSQYEVQSGDTCGGIASKYGVPLSTFLALNKLTEDPCLIRVGDKVLIPQPTATPGPTQTPKPTETLAPGVTPQPSNTPQATATLPPQIIYQVKGGDTCSDIAQKYRITVDTLVQQNNLDASCTLQIGQVLTLTFAVPTPAMSPTPNIAQTPTPRVGYDAPLLVSPPDGAQISETQQVVTLQWLSVGLLKDDEWYVVQIQPSGAITVPIFETKATSIKITRDIFGGQPERVFAWWVQVKQLQGVDAASGERQYTERSPVSPVRRFTWRRPNVTPTATSAP